MNQFFSSGAAIVAATLVCVAPAAAQAGLRVVQPSDRLASAPDAQLYAPDAGRLRFAVSESLYVAVFELLPGRGVRVVYPADDGAPELAVGPGWQTSPMRGSDALANEPGSALDAGPDGVRYLYLVASRRPLGPGPGRRTPAALSRMTGLLDFRSASPETQAAAILAHAVTLRGGSDWTTSGLIATRPGYADPVGRAAEPLVRCGDGRVYRVVPGTTFQCPR